MKVRGREACYHVMSRTVNGERLFGEREREMLRRMLWRAAEFSGVEVLTYALMGNHFHILVRVPERGELDDAELVRRCRLLYLKPTRYQPLTASEVAKTLASGGEEAEALRARLMARMGDVSEFMKTLKQRFTIWFNRTHGRYGPLWSDRFKSVLVEGRGNPLQTMAAYIDLNPVRAGLVKDPKDYRYCGYAEAVAGNRKAQAGLRFVWSAYAGGGSRSLSVEEALRAHRGFVFAKGLAGASTADRTAMLKVLEAGGSLPRTDVLRCRVKYLTAGAVLGSAEFVRGFVGRLAAEPGRRRPPKVRPLRGADWGDLAVLKGTRGALFS